MVFYVSYVTGFYVFSQYHISLLSSLNISDISCEYFFLTLVCVMLCWQADVPAVDDFMYVTYFTGFSDIALSVTIDIF